MSIDVETYDGIGISGDLEWLPAPVWSLSMGGWWLRRFYDRRPGGGSRQDDEYGVQFSLTRSLARFDLFVDLLRMRNRSPVATEDYRRTVVQCGAIFQF